jgi:hypothetical protein
MARYKQDQTNKQWLRRLRYPVSGDAVDPGSYPVSDNPRYSMGECTLIEYILCVNSYSLASVMS